MKKVLIAASIVIASILLSLGIVEIGIRIFAPQPRYYNPRYLFTADNELGFVLTPDFKGEMRTPESTTTIKINSSGQRDKEYSGNSEVSILALGDSFAFGSGVEIEDTFLWKIEENLNKNNGNAFRIIKTGVPGYGTWQEYLYFRRKGIEYNPDLVIVCFYLNDVTDNITPPNTVIDGYVVPSEKVLALDKKNKKFTFTKKLLVLFDNLETTRFVINRLSATPYFRKLFLKSVEKSKGRKGNRLDLYRQNYEPELINAWQITHEYLKGINALAKKRRGEMLVVYIPERQQVYADQWRIIMKQYNINEQDYDILKPNQLLRFFCQKEGINFLDLTDEFRDAITKGSDIYFTMDPHLNKKGHALAAELIYEQITGKALIPLQ